MRFVLEVLVAVIISLISFVVLSEVRFSFFVSALNV
jgi:hypothetical protein